ncbi:hypothetical protein MXB_2119, partial [Myxobolus squamalis]
YHLFILDPFKTRAIKINDFFRSTILEKIYDINHAFDYFNENWFTYKYLLQHYEQFKSITHPTYTMDESALRKLPYFNPNNGFICRFQEMNAHNSGHHDYEHYVNLILAYNSMLNIQSLKYFFDILDTNCDNYVCDWDIKYFYKANISEAMNNENNQKFKNFSDEIFDIVLSNRRDLRKFSLIDLIECKQGDIIIKLLIDSHSFDEFESI